MPKLNGTHLPERLASRLADLKSGKEVAARDIKALLSAEQIADMDAAWAEQQQLRKKKRARTKEEEAALGWKTKRDIHIAAIESALREAQDGELAAWEKRLHDAEVRQGHVFFDELSKQRDAGVDMQTAKTRANNALTRAGLRRLDGELIGTQGLTKRDREIRALEEQILGNPSPEKKEDQDEHLNAPREAQKPSGKRTRKR